MSSILGTEIDKIKMSKSNPKKKFKLTSRQLEIIMLWEELGSAEKVAKHLNISVHTVRTHLKRAKIKANVKKTWELLLIIKK